MTMQYNLTNYLLTSELGEKYRNSNGNNVSTVPNADRLNFRLGLGPLARAATVMAVVKNPNFENPLAVPTSDYIEQYTPFLMSHLDYTKRKREDAPNKDENNEIRTPLPTQQNRKPRTDYNIYTNQYSNPYIDKEEDTGHKDTGHNQGDRRVLFYSGNPNAEISRKSRQGYSRKNCEARFRQGTVNRVIYTPSTADLETRVQKLAA